MSSGKHMQSFTTTRQASVSKSRRSRSLAARLPLEARTINGSSNSAEQSAAVRAAASDAIAAAESSAASPARDFPLREYRDDVMKYIKQGLEKFKKFMPRLSPKKEMEWDIPTLLTYCSSLYDSLPPALRLLSSHPASLEQRKKTLACNIAFSCAPYDDVNPKRQRAEFNRLFGAARNGPCRLSNRHVPDKVKQQVDKLKNKKKDKAKAGESDNHDVADMDM